VRVANRRATTPALDHRGVTRWRYLYLYLYLYLYCRSSWTSVRCYSASHGLGKFDAVYRR
jgi:hypothetical protein